MYAKESCRASAHRDAGRKQGAERVFEKAEFLALQAALPDPVNSIVTLAYHSGFRKGEILGLTWDRVDLQRRTITLNPGMTKNREGRVLYMNNELLAEMKAMHSKRRLDCPYVFRRNGQPVKDFREAWDKECICSRNRETMRR